ncbi:E3 ubiquitin-protein ligase rififylin-like [Centruroides vittatus]|uniref:E3 ubiquitin-protein ligase rififylin-like n=1 Tax=Centruroides vittatus TaxID=120091 RepID=UPI00350F8261
MGIAAFHGSSAIRQFNQNISEPKSNQVICSICQANLRYFKRKRICSKCKSLCCTSCIHRTPNKHYYCCTCFNVSLDNNRNIQDAGSSRNCFVNEGLSATSDENFHHGSKENARKTITIDQERRNEFFCARKPTRFEDKSMESKNGTHLLTVSDIECLTEIPDLTVRQLKLILTRNYVDYRGCCEKKDLQEKVRQLWQQKRLNGNSNDLSDDSLCKICMAESIDCVLLECGHMATCTECGKKLCECPLCRQYVVRIVHIFKA